MVTSEDELTHCYLLWRTEETYGLKQRRLRTVDMLIIPASVFWFTYSLLDAIASLYFKKKT